MPVIKLKIDNRNLRFSATEEQVNAVNSFDTLKTLIDTGLNGRRDAPQINRLHYTLIDSDTEYEMDTTEDVVLVMNNLNTLDQILINYQPNEEKIDVNDQNHGIIQNNQNNHIQNVRSPIQIITDKIIAKEATEFSEPFDGTEAKLVSFEAELIAHQKRFNLSNKIIFTLCMSGKYITGDALTVLKLHEAEFNEIEVNEINGAGYEARVNKIWKVLTENYATVDQVVRIKEELKSFKQQQQNTKQYLNLFKIKVVELRRQIAFRNKVSGAIIHPPVATNELAEILRKNLSKDAKKYLYDESERTYNTVYIDFEKSEKILHRYARIEQANINDEAYNGKKHKIYAWNNNNNNDNINNYESKEMCRNGTLNNCNYNGCKFAHFETTAQFNNYKNKIIKIPCRFGVQCKFRNTTCLFGHPYVAPQNNQRGQRRENNARSTADTVCWNYTKEKCNRRDCKFKHISTDDLIKYKERVKDTICDFDSKCKNRNCVYKHTKPRTIEVGTHHIGMVSINSNPFGISDHEMNEINARRNGKITETIIYNNENENKTNGQLNNSMLPPLASMQPQQSNDKQAQLEIRGDEKKEFNKLEKKGDDKYELVDSHKNEDLMHRILQDITIDNIKSNNIDEKWTTRLKIFKQPDIDLIVFIDCGADANISGDDMEKVLGDTYKSKTRKSIQAVAMDSNKTNKSYKLDKSHILPIAYKHFDYVKGKDMIIPKDIRFWQFDGIPNNVIILGRPGIRALKMGLTQRNGWKKFIYYHTKGQNPSLLSEYSDEDMNVLFENLNYRFGGEPGIRRMHYKYNQITNVDRIIKEASEEKTAQIHYINTQKTTKNGIRDYIKDLEQFESVLKDQNISQHEKADNNDNNNKTQILAVKTMPSETELPMNIINEIKDYARNNKVEIDTKELLEHVVFGSEILTAQLNNIYKEIEVRKLRAVISKGLWDVGRANVDPFTMKIKDINKCRIMKHYDLNEVDDECMDDEVEWWIKKKVAHYQRIDEEVLHASPGFIVHHKVGELSDGSDLVKSRAAINYIALNDNTYKLNINVGFTLDEFIDHLSQFNYFYYFDITKYFYGIPIDEFAKKFTPMIWRKGVVVFEVVSTGLKNAPLFGQKLTYDAFRGTDCVPVQDDCFGGGVTLDECINRFLNALDICKKHGFKISPKSIACGVPEVRGNGFKINAKGARPLPHLTTKALKTDVKKIKTYKDWEVYRGYLEVLNHWVPALSEDIYNITKIIISPVELDKIKKSNGTAKQKRAAREKIQLKWTDEALYYIEIINKQIENLPLLHHPIRTKDAPPLLVKVDASRYGIGCTLWQLRLLHYVLCKIRSKALSITQQNYSASEKECLSIITAFIWFGKYLSAKVFTLICDHQPLEQLFNVNLTSKNDKLLRWKIIVNTMEFVFDWQSRNSLSIKLEDYLSKLTFFTNNPDNENKYKIDGVTVPVDKTEIDDILNVLKNGYNDNNNDASTRINMLKRLYKIQVIEVYQLEDNNKKQTQLNPLANQIYPSLNLKIEGENMTNNIYNVHTLLNFNELKSPSQKNKKILNKFREINMLSSIASIHTIQQEHESLLNMKPYHRIDIEEYNNYKKSIETVELMQNMTNQYERNRDNIRKLNMDAIYLANETRFVLDNCDQSIKILNEINEMQIHINAMTRSKAKLKREKEKDEALIPTFKPYKGYLFAPEEGNVFINQESNVSPMERLYNEQQNIYKNLIKFIVTGKKYYDRPSLKSMFDIDYYNGVKNGKITINDEGLIVYNGNRYLIPDSLRNGLLLYYHTHPATGWHGSTEDLINAFRKRFYWMLMIDRCRSIVNSCVCKTVKAVKRKELGYKDKGYLITYYSIRQNQNVFFDLWGPTHTGNYVAVFLDGFDACTVIQPMKPLFDISALGIIQIMQFCWVYRYGNIENLIGDNDAKNIARINKFYCWIIGTLRKYIMTYSPWKDAAETRMRNINKAVLLEGTRRELECYKEIKEGLMNGKALELSDKDLNKLCYGLELVQMNKKRDTGYTPRELRVANGSSVVLDMQLNLDLCKLVKEDKYLIDGLVDYNKFYKFLKQQQQIINKDAALRKLKKLNTKQFKNEEDGLLKQQIKLYDHVMLRKPFKSKLKNNFKMGWAVTGINNNKGKIKYEITNVINMDKEIVDKAKIERVLKPHFMNRNTLFENEITRMIDLDRKKEIKSDDEEKDDEKAEQVIASLRVCKNSEFENSFELIEDYNSLGQVNIKSNNKKLSRWRKSLGQLFEDEQI